MTSNPNDTPVELTTGWEALLREQQKTIGAWAVRGGRKGKARRREDILGERFTHVILQKLEDTFYNKEIKRRMRNHIGVVINLGHDITRALACVYKQQPKRSFEGGTEEQNKALLAINRSTRWSSKAETINRMAWFAGPVLEMPVVRGKVLSRHILPCSKIDVQMSDDDPLGHPIAASYPWHEEGIPVIKVVDSVNIRTFKAGTSSAEPLSVVPHGCTGPDGEPRFPGTLWRFDDPTDIYDYFNKDRNERLVDSTIECGMIYCSLSWIRKSQNRKLMIAMGNLEGLAAGSTIDSERPALWMVDEQDDMPVLDVRDMDTAPANFINHIQFIAMTAIRAHGIPDSALSFNFGEGQGETVVMALSLQHEQLTELRRGQIRFAHEAELRSQYNIASLAKANDLPEADDLPDLGEFQEMLRVEFSDLTRIEDPGTTQAETDWELKRGQTNDALIYCQKHPHVTLEEALQAVKDNLETQAELNELKATRNNAPDAPMLDDNEETGAMRSDPEPEPIEEP